MSRPARSPWLPLVAGFGVWFVHFLLCWVAVELWPRQWQANAVAWGLTALALLALGWQWRALQRPAPADALPRWTAALGRGATAIAAAAVVFSAVPSVLVQAT